MTQYIPILILCIEEGGGGGGLNQGHTKTSSCYILSLVVFKKEKGASK